MPTGEVIEVCGLYVVTLPNHRPTFEWYTTRLVITSGCQKNICHNEIEVHAQNTHNIRGSIVNTFKSTYVIAQT